MSTRKQRDFSPFGSSIDQMRPAAERRPSPRIFALRRDRRKGPYALYLLEIPRGFLRSVGSPLRFDVPLRVVLTRAHDVADADQAGKALGVSAADEVVMKCVALSTPEVVQEP